MAISPDRPGQGAHENSPPSSLSTALTAQQQQSQQSTSHPSNAPAPSLVRRSSFEPMRLGLSSLPPPVFSRGPPGQRSVPAIEFLNKENGLTGLSSTSAGGGPILGGATGNTAAMGQSGVVALPAVLGSGATTPAAGLGNGSMTSEPWNLWSDPTAPAADGASKANPANELSSSTGQANTTNVDSELASALAAAVVLDKNADKRSSIASRISNSSAGGGGEKGTAATSWPEGLANDNGKALQPQNFALGINASPERVRDGPGGDLVR